MAYKAAVSLNPYSKSSFRDYALTLEKLKRYDDAIKIYQSILSVFELGYKDESMLYNNL